MQETESEVRFGEYVFNMPLGSRHAKKKERKKDGLDGVDC